MLTSTGNVEPATSTAATIGVWATTSRPRVMVRQSPMPQQGSGGWRQVQRMEIARQRTLSGERALKDRFSMDEPKTTLSLQTFFLIQRLRVFSTRPRGVRWRFPIPTHRSASACYIRTTIIAASGTPSGPIADLLRLNTGVHTTAIASRNRLGLLAGDAGGYPNGRRLFDDVTDISLRAR